MDAFHALMKSFHVLRALEVVSFFRHPSVCVCGGGGGVCCVFVRVCMFACTRGGRCVYGTAW